jgi:hypothetical protein
MCEEGAFPGIHREVKFGHHCWKLSPIAIEAISEIFRATMARSEVAARLHLAPYQISGLMQLGVLKRLFAGWGDIFERFHFGDVERILGLLEALSEPLGGGCPPKNQLRRLSDVYAFERHWKNIQIWTQHMGRVFSGEDVIYQLNPSTDEGFQAYFARAPVLGPRRKFVRPTSR